MSSEIRDIHLAESGARKIEWVRRNCDLLRTLEEEFSKTKPFAGKKADLAILNLNVPSLTPRNNLIAGLSYSANGSEVETVIIDGKITMENRKILTMDEELVYKKVNEIITRMGLDKKEY